MFFSKLQIEGTENEIESYYKALHPEEKSESERASYKLKKEKNKLTIEITAEDATAFRAVTNTLLGLISVVEKTIKAVK